MGNSTNREYKNNLGQLHRLDGPAVESADKKEWCVEGKRHRLDGPAIEWTDGYKSWWVENKLHRLDGPAVKHVNRKEWWVNGLLHRLGGPAIEWTNGSKEWWVEGKRYYPDQQEINREIKDEKTDNITQQCKICYNNKAIMALVPCGHVFSCASCSKQLKNCSICRVNITNRIKVYYPE